MSVTAREPSREFWQKVVLMAIDKVIFGLLIVLAGFVLNRVLERERSLHETRAEIARLRVDHVARVSKALDDQQYAIEAEAVSAVQVARLEDGYIVNHLAGRPPQASLGPSGQFPAELRREAAVVTSRQKVVRRLLVTNRFWIGERSYRQYLDYEQNEEALGAAYGKLWRIAFKDQDTLLQHDIRVLKTTSQRPSDFSHLTASERATFRRAHERYVAALQNIGARRTALRDARVDVFKVMSNLS